MKRINTSTNSNNQSYYLILTQKLKYVNSDLFFLVFNILNILHILRVVKFACHIFMVCI